MDSLNRNFSFRPFLAEYHWMKVSSLLMCTLLGACFTGCAERDDAPKTLRSAEEQSGTSSSGEARTASKEQIVGDANHKTETISETQAILADLKSENWKARRDAARRFPFRAPLELRSAIPVLIKSLESEHDSLVLAAATALSGLADRESGDRIRLPELQPAIRPLSAIVGGTAPTETRRWATIAIHDIGVNLGPETVESILPVLTAAAADPSYDVSRFAMEGLGEMGMDAQMAIPTLIKQLRNGDLRASVAAQALGQIGSEPEACVPALLKTLPLAQNNYVIQNIVTALGGFGEAAKESVSALSPLVSHNDKRVQREVIMALAKIGPEAKSTIAEVERAFQSAPDRDVRFAVLAALSAFGPSGLERAKNLVQEIRQFEPCREVYETKTLPGILEVLASAPNLVRLDLRGYDLTDDDLIPLTKMTRLEELIVPVSITDKGIRHFSKLPKLRAITLTGDAITHEGLAHVQKMSTLKAVAIWGDGLTDEGLRHFQNSQGLEYLMLGSNNLTDAAIPIINRFENLKTLHLQSEKFTEQGICSLTDLKNLTDMRLPNCIGDEGVQAIVNNHVNLQYLSLDFTNVTLASIDALKQLKQLEWLSVIETPIANNYSQSSIAIDQAMPDCEVQYFRRGLTINDLFGN